MPDERTTNLIELTTEERTELEVWSRRQKSAQALALRARIVLRCADGQANSEVVRFFRGSRQTVIKWRRRFIERRLDGLLDEPRPGAPRKIGDEQINAIVTRTLEATPRGATHWSTRSMAEACGLSHASVQRIWKVFGLQPHRVDTFKLSTDPLFVEKVRDIVRLYMNPSERALVLSVDEKSQIQALNRTRRFCPCNQGSRNAEAMTTNGMAQPLCFRRWLRQRAKSSANVIAATGQARCESSLTRSTCPPIWMCMSLMDNYGTHKTVMIRNWFARRPKFHAHFTPTSSSWINMVERFFAALTDKQIRRGIHRSTQQLEKPFVSTWRSTMKRRSRSAGSSPLTISSPASFDPVNELQLRTPGSNMLVESGYIGNTGNKQVVTVWVNQPRLPENPDAPTPFAARSPYRNLVPGFSMNANYQWSNYNAVYVKYEKRTGSGLSWTLAHTYSKTIDSGGAGQNMHDRRPERGLADNDVRHNFIGGWVWDLPVGRGRRVNLQNQFLNAVARVWQVNGIANFRSGTPYTIGTANDLAKVGTGGQRADTTGVEPRKLDPRTNNLRGLDPAAYSVPARGTFGNLARNTQPGFGINNWDFSAIKNFAIPPLGETSRLQLRFEFFNVFNHTQFLNPAATINVPATFGLVSGTLDPGILQIGGKLYW